MMDFTYESYTALIRLIRDSGYSFCGYHDYQEHERCVIMRHDIDFQPSLSLKLAEVEAENGVHSTYFALITSDFYNAASDRNRSVLKRIRELGHEVGLHYDEVAYESCGNDGSERENVERILRERDILSQIIDAPVTAVSMHRPSRNTLEADWKIPGMVNSYSKLFFREFKYLSDSRRNWREPVMDIVRNKEYDRLHILTHAFWYHETDEPIEAQVRNFILSANEERYRQMQGNLRDLKQLMSEEEL